MRYIAELAWDGPKVGLFFGACGEGEFGLGHSAWGYRHAQFLGARKVSAQGFGGNL